MIHQRDEPLLKCRLHQRDHRLDLKFAATGVARWRLRDKTSKDALAVASMRPPGLRGKIEARACEHAAGYKEREQGEAFLDQECVIQPIKPKLPMECANQNDGIRDYNDS